MLRKTQCILFLFIIQSSLFSQIPWNSLLNANKLSPSAKLLFLQKMDSNIFVQNATNFYDCFIQTNDGVDFETYNISSNQLLNRYGNLHHVSLTKSQITSIIQDENIQHIEISNRFTSPRPQNNISKGLSRVVDAQNSKPGFPLKGSNTIVGIVDIGFQTTHPTFYNENGQLYRVKRFWHQGYPNQDGPSPYKYGILYSNKNAILNAVDYDGTHGTHVAGIAAGSGFPTINNEFGGMAPDANLVFVAIKYKNDTIGGSALGDYLVANTTILDGFDYVFNYADSVRMPAVCNLSWGMHTGPHDGTSLFDIALDNLLKKPYKWNNSNIGKVIVGANGNDAMNNMHVKISLKNDTLETLAMDRSRTSFKTENVYCDFWAEKNSDIKFSISLIDSQNNVLIQSPYYKFDSNFAINTVFTNNLDSLTIVLAGQKEYINNGKSNVLTMVECNSINKFIKLSFTGNGEINGWNSGRTYEWTSGTFRSYIQNLKPKNWVEGDDLQTMIENGGTSKSIISVGATNNRVNWVNYENIFKSDSTIAVGDIANFSSKGPTIDNRIKPDISAPGRYIASAYHKDQVPVWLAPSILFKGKFNDDDVYYAMSSGTSMAAPHVAGIAALILQASNNSLDFNQVSEIIKTTAIKDEFTGQTVNNTFGYGKINAYEAAKMAYSHASLKNTKQMNFLLYANTTEININAKNGRIEDFNIEILDLSGKIIQKYTALNGSNQLTKPLIEGIYIFKITDILNQVHYTKYLVEEK